MSEFEPQPPVVIDDRDMIPHSEDTFVDQLSTISAAVKGFSTGTNEAGLYYFPDNFFATNKDGVDELKRSVVYRIFPHMYSPQYIKAHTKRVGEWTILEGIIPGDRNRNDKPLWFVVEDFGDTAYLTTTEPQIDAEIPDHPTAD